MSATILKDEERTARKHYKCDAFARFHNCGMRRDELAPDQQLMLDAAEADKGRILPGQRYRYARGLHEGSMFTWRERIGMGSICRAHGLYED